MSCPLGFTESDGIPNPHTKPSRPQPPQSDGRIPPPLPPRPAKRATPWHESHVKQGPVPAWAAFIAAWYNQLWNLCRALILASFLLFLTPVLHIACWLTLRVPAQLPTRIQWLLWQPARGVQWLYGGLVVFVCESMAGGIFMFAGRVETTFWEAHAADATATSVRTASTVPNAGGAIPPVRVASSTSSSTASVAPDVTVFVSNQPSATCFVDCLAFFSIAYRRRQLSSLYFFPIDTSEWGIGSRLLRCVFLAPLQVQGWEVERVVARGTPCSFVSFAEATPMEDAEDEPADTTPSSSIDNDLLHVRPPVLSRSMMDLLLSCTNGVTSSSRRTVSVVEVTLAYSGSVHAELESKAQEALSNGALDEEEQEEFERAAAAQSPGSAASDEGEDEDDGYSAASINNYAHGRITTRVAPRKFNPSMTPVFCSAAPLPERLASSAALDSRAPPNASPRSGRAATALQRVRVLPSFFSYLSGNAPSTIGVLLNQHDDAYVRRRILQLPDAASSSPDARSASTRKQTHLSAEQEASGEVSAARSSAVAAATAWLQQRFLHQEQQLSLYALHATFHSLPPGLSASSIPVCSPLESYALPISSMRAAGFLALAWVAIVCGTIAMRNLRASIIQGLHLQ